VSQYSIQKFLGAGVEGAVYLVNRVEKDDPLVLKLFHEPRSGMVVEGLEAYAKWKPPAGLGLPPVALLRRQNQVIGLWYPHTALHHMHPRLLRCRGALAKILVCHYCEMQACMIRERGLAQHDSGIQQFMLSSRGRFHRVDFGQGIAAIDSPYVQFHGEVGLGLCQLLCSSCGVVDWTDDERTNDYRYDEPCYYFVTNAGSLRALRYGWARDVAENVLSQPASVLSDWRFYESLSHRLKAKVRVPGAWIAASRALAWFNTKFRKMPALAARPPLPEDFQTTMEELSRTRGRREQ
jgi:hypothetical protein